MVTRANIADDKKTTMVELFEIFTSVLISL